MIMYGRRKKIKLVITFSLIGLMISLSAMSTPVNASHNSTYNVYFDEYEAWPVFVYEETIVGWVPIVFAINFHQSLDMLSDRIETSGFIITDAVSHFYNVANGCHYPFQFDISAVGVVFSDPYTREMWGTNTPYIENVLADPCWVYDAKYDHNLLYYHSSDTLVSGFGLYYSNQTWPNWLILQIQNNQDWSQVY